MRVDPLSTATAVCPGEPPLGSMLAAAALEGVNPCQPALYCKCGAGGFDPVACTLPASLAGVG